MPSREPELYKDKIEVSLDGRQIFYLFFGGAAIVGLVFVLGVMVGRRVEARGHLDRADTPSASDPLAALDRLERSDNLSFHGALTGTEAPTDVDKAIGELEKRRTGGKPEAKAEVKAEAIARPDADKPKADKRDGDKHDGDKHDGDKHDGDKKAKKADKAEKPVTRPEARADAKPDGKEARAEGKPELAARSETRPEGKPELAARSETRPDGKPDAKTDGKPDGKGKFTLQLSSFQDKAEAEAFLSSMKSSGYQPYLTQAEVTGKGTFYRVRLGTYRSVDAANDAKADFEKAARKTAQVMRL